MNKIVLNTTFFLILWLIIFLLDYFFVLRRKTKSKKKNNREIMEYNYLIGKFHLDEKKVLYKPLSLWCAFLNGFIISFVVTVITNIKLSFMWQILIGFVLLFLLIYSIYEIYGRHLVKKGWKKKNE